MSRYDVAEWVALALIAVGVALELGTGWGLASAGVLLLAGAELRGAAAVEADE